MSDGSGEIIIKGGSVEVSFDTGLYRKQSELDPVSHKHETRKITRVKVVDENKELKFDSGLSDEGLKWTITVSTSDK